MENRTYPYPDALVLAAGKVVASSLRCCIKELSDIRSVWKRDYITSLDTRLDTAFVDILSCNIEDIHRFLKSDIYDLLQQIAFNLTCLKVQVEVDNSHNLERLAELKKHLGFSRFNQKFSKLSEEKLVLLLNLVVDGLTPAIRIELQNNGVSSYLLSKIEKQAALINDIKQVQSFLLQPNQKLTAENIATLNSLYNEIIGICIVATAYFEEKPKKRDRFNFLMIVNRLQGVISEELG